MSKMKLALDVAHDLQSLVDSLKALANAVMADSPVDAADFPDPSVNMDAQVEPKIGIVELRAFVAERSTLENRPKIKEILNRFGVNKLTELAEDKYAALKREVAAL